MQQSFRALPWPACLAALSLAVLAAPLGAFQQGYRLPPPEVVEILDAAPTPAVRLSPDARWLLFVERPSMPSIAEVSRPWVGLAGLRVDPRNGSRQRTSYDTGLVLRDLAGANERRIELPAGARIGGVSWSHTSRQFAFTLVGDERVDLWVVEVASARAREVARGLCTMLTGGFEWASDGQRLLVHLVPAERGSAPAEPRVPTGPAIQETSGSTSPVRTYQDLLENTHDEALFEHLGRSQLAVVDPASSATTKIGAPDLYVSTEFSPDGRHLYVARIRRPFSYVMTYRSFPETHEVWSAEGERERVVAELPAAENVPIGGVPLGPRSLQWRPGKPASLLWVEALDGGDPKAEAEQRDRWMELASFDAAAQPTELLRTAQRATGLTWLEDSRRVLAGEYDRDRRWTLTRLIDLGDPSAEPVIFDDRSVRDRYGNPGSPLLEVTTEGRRVLRQDGRFVYRSGNGESDGGARPFLDRYDLESGESERLWRCSPGSYETLVAVAISGKDRKPTVVTRYESPDEPPNYRLRNLEEGSARPLTSFPDPTPQLRGIKKELVTYGRADGVALSATLYLPKGYEEGTRLPLFVWAYPREYSDPDTAGQVSGSPFRFTRVGGSSHLFLLTQGWAVLDAATMPIVGDAETMNDTFVEQIVASAQAAIDHAVELGVADRERVAVGGHSYGAFMTANLLAHCDLFKAGIARSGAYNRTLTPFGFQSERRTLWEAPHIYAAVSPFFHADRINEPLLMIHGEKDNNSGTFPIQSERLFQAVKGHGGTARLVMLPHESHGYSARESILHTLAEMIEWLDVHVKQPAAGKPVEAGFEEGR